MTRAAVRLAVKVPLQLGGNILLKMAGRAGAITHILCDGRISAGGGRSGSKYAEKEGKD
jgi:hypothetical protein